MDGDVTGKDEAILAEALVIAAAHWSTYPLPQELLAAPATPLALYIAIKYLQSLPPEHEHRIHEYAMKLILVERYTDFAERALGTDPAPAELAPQEPAPLFASELMLTRDYRSGGNSELR